MTDTRSLLRNLVIAAQDLDPVVRSNLIYCLETAKLPLYQVEGPLYVNATRAAELLGVGRTKFPEVAEFRGIQAHEMTEGWFMYYTPDLIVHQTKEIQANQVGLAFKPPAISPNQRGQTLDVDCAA